jgi:hypothetical protein
VVGGVIGHAPAPNPAPTAENGGRRASHR